MGYPFACETFAYLLCVHELRLEEGKDGVLNVPEDRLVVDVPLLPSRRRRHCDVAVGPGGDGEGSTSVRADGTVGQSVRRDPGESEPGFANVDGAVEFFQQRRRRCR